jgi:hypothetical protein
MKPFERITLVAVATAYSGYLIHHAARARADERCCRLAAGESAFERTRVGYHFSPRWGQVRRSQTAAAGRL